MAGTVAGAAIKTLLLLVLLALILLVGLEAADVFSMSERPVIFTNTILAATTAGALRIMIDTKTRTHIRKLHLPGAPMLACFQLGIAAGAGLVLYLFAMGTGTIPIGSGIAGETLSGFGSLIYGFLAGQSGSEIYTKII